MIAQIWIFRRMPRRVSFFDYTIPEHLPIHPGDLVEVPFGKKILLGLVVACTPLSTHKRLKQVKKRTQPSFLSKEEIHVIKDVSRELIQSPCSLIHTLIPTPPKRSSASVKSKTSTRKPLRISRVDAESIKQTLLEMSLKNKAFVRIPGLAQSAALIAGYHKHHPRETLIILCPTNDQKDLLFESLRFLYPTQAHGGQTNNQRYQAWQSIKTGETHILIGTGLALFLFPKQPATLFILQSGHRNHKQFDRNPRFDARMSSHVFIQHLQTKQFFLDVLPRVDDVLWFKEAFVNTFPLPRIKTIEKNQSSSLLWIWQSTRELIETTLEKKKNVLLILNHLESVPIVQQQCNELFGKARVRVITQGFAEHEFYLQPPTDIGMMIHLSPDLALGSDKLRAQEDALIEQARWQAMAQTLQADYAIQTDHKALFEADPFVCIKEEATRREAYGQPPFRQWLRLTADQKSLQNILGNLQTLETNLFWIGPFEQQERWHLDIGILPHQRDGIQTALFSLPDHIIIDAHAYS